MNVMVLGRLREALASRSIDERVDALELLVGLAEHFPELAGDVAACVLMFLALVDDFTAARAERSYDELARRLGYPPLREAASGKVVPLEVLGELSELRVDLSIPDARNARRQAD
jgi:hypothetical protein